jgi:primosomal protein N'
MTCGAPQPNRRIASVYPLVPAWRVDRAFDYLVPDKLVPKLVPGSLVRIPLGHRVVRGVVDRIEAGRESPEALQEVKSLVLEEPVIPSPLDELAAWVATRYVVPRARAFERFVPRRVRVQPAVLAPAPGAAPNALAGYEGGEELRDALRSGSGSTWVLQASPHAGRAALIGEIASLACSGGGTALIAVPEVRYGSRVIEGVASVWGGIGRVDSAVGEAERARAWLGAAAGGLVAGGRSAVFVPAPDLRVIVIDEEHHPGYKEDRSPRYDARRVAVERARLQGATCVLISGCPSVEAGAAAVSGRFGWAGPPRVAQKAARPIVEVVEPSEGRVLHRTFHARIHDALAGGRRVAVLSPRRGFARTVWCRDCRRSLRCPRCETGLFYDRGASRVRCGRCGLTSDAPASCPYCDGAGFAFLGAGSERLAEQLSKAFPSARVLRVDPDVLDGRPPETAQADIYVTTWIGTKEVLRPDVGVVAVLDADALIRSPDFRAAERAYQALAEMAEWAGPSSEDGRLLIGSREPGHHSIQAVVRGDHRFFLDRELRLRKELGYPPFSELVKVSTAGDQAVEASRDVARECRAAGARVLGPVRVAPGGKEEFEILAKAPDANEVARALRGILKTASRARIRVDVDPR